MQTKLLPLQLDHWVPLLNRKVLGPLAFALLPAAQNKTQLSFTFSPPFFFVLYVRHPSTDIRLSKSKRKADDDVKQQTQNSVKYEDKTCLHKYMKNIWKKSNFPPHPKKKCRSTPSSYTPHTAIHKGTQPFWLPPIAYANCWLSPILYANCQELA